MVRKRILNLFIVAVAFAISSPALSEKPNILVILADDLGYGDLGFTGSKEILTPRLDALAKGGVICLNGYVTHSYCGPSRAGLLTGRYQARFGMEINCSYSPYDPYMGLPPNEQTFGKRLQQAGYRTGIIGKWHVGAAPPHHPNNRGFDYFYGFLSGGHTYWPEEVSTAKPLFLEDGSPNYSVNEGCFLPLLRNSDAAAFDEYLTTALSRDAARFIRESEKPFCLYLAYNAPHAPLQAPKETIARYTHIADRNRRTYAAMIDEMDRGIGMVVDALKESGKLEKTVIFFLSDNGGVGSPPWNPSENWADNGPFRQGKASWLEGGIHVPFLVHWPGRLKAGTFDGLVSALDIAATAVALAGGDTSGKPLDGVNLIPYLTGEKTDSPHPALFWRERDSTSWAVRTPHAKYVKSPWEGGTICLYDMVNDPYEEDNLIDRAPEKRKELARMWNEWNAGNEANLLLHASDYQKRRKQMYEALYRECVEKQARAKPVIIE
jgi:arylsulfatase A-like enzyme